MASDPSSPDRRPRYPGLSRTQTRAVQKELLIARATIARLTIVDARDDLSAGYRRFGWLGLLVPKLGGRDRDGLEAGTGLLHKLPGFLRPALQLALPLLRRHPLISAALSLLMVGGEQGGSGTLQRAGRSAKFVSVALVGLKALGLVKRLNIYRHDRRVRRDDRARRAAEK